METHRNQKQSTDLDKQIQTVWQRLWQRHAGNCIEIQRWKSCKMERMGERERRGEKERERLRLRREHRKREGRKTPLPFVCFPLRCVGQQVGFWWPSFVAVYLKLFHLQAGCTLHIKSQGFWKEPEGPSENLLRIFHFKAEKIGTPKEKVDVLSVTVPVLSKQGGLES